MLNEMKEESPELQGVLENAFNGAKSAYDRENIQLSGFSKDDGAKTNPVNNEKKPNFSQKNKFQC